MTSMPPIGKRKVSNNEIYVFRGADLSFRKSERALTHIVPNGRFRPCIFINFKKVLVYVCALLKKIQGWAWISAFICKKQNISNIHTSHFIMF
jgi:hypothetical protein